MISESTNSGAFADSNSRGGGDVVGGAVGGVVVAILLLLVVRCGDNFGHVYHEEKQKES